MTSSPKRPAGEYTKVLLVGPGRILHTPKPDSMRSVIERPVRIRLEFRWQALGPVQFDGSNSLVFPAAPRQPGLYRFLLSGNGATRHYVGETEKLQQRFQRYRTPGKSQQTNIRMNAKFRAHLTTGGRIEVDIVTGEITVLAADEPIEVDLSCKAMRRLLEHAALVDEDAAGTMLLNR